jgi:hypothetical protein
MSNQKRRPNPRKNRKSKRENLEELLQWKSRGVIFLEEDSSQKIKNRNKWGSELKFQRISMNT